MAENGKDKNMTIGRFAPSPTGRMHLGNIFTALISRLSAKRQGGKWILRIEDLDPQRSRTEYAKQLEDDLHWLGLEWDSGGLDDRNTDCSFQQSRRGGIYSEYLARLHKTGLTYPCFCTKADIRATQAPHASDGRIIYPGTCRPARQPYNTQPINSHLAHAFRIFVPDREIHFTDRLFGERKVNPAQECGDFVLQRADGAWAYQFAVVVDDALMGVTEVVRGVDLLDSSATQIYLYNLLGFNPPEFFHLPLICNAEGKRLSKRDPELAMDVLRKKYTPERIIGMLAHLAGQIPAPEEISFSELLSIFDPARIPAVPAIRLS